jgi:hypothetical protein
MTNVPFSSLATHCFKSCSLLTLDRSWVADKFEYWEMEFGKNEKSDTIRKNLGSNGDLALELSFLPKSQDVRVETSRQMLESMGALVGLQML